LIGQILVNFGLTETKQRLVVKLFKQSYTLSSLYVCMAIKYIILIVLFVVTPPSLVLDARMLIGITSLRLKLRG
jgi:hypothetical protein